MLNSQITELTGVIGYPNEEDFEQYWAMQRRTDAHSKEF